MNPYKTFITDKIDEGDQMTLVYNVYDVNNSNMN